MRPVSLPLLLILALLQARPFGEERQLLDRHLETLSRILPDGPALKADVALSQQLAEQAGLMDVDALARPPLEAGDRGFVVVDVTALGLYVEVDRFFRQVALSPRLVDVESLTLSGTPDERVRLQAVLRFPFRPPKAPLPQPPEGTRDDVRNVPRSLAESYLRDQALALAKSETIESLRRAQRNPRLFLAELAASVRDRPVVLSYAHFGPEFLVRGLTVGAGPTRALETRMERGFFRVSEFLVARDGACHRFEVRGLCPVAGPEAVLPIPAEDPFRPDDAPCRVDRDPPGARTARAPSGRSPGKGPLSLRLRDLDLADVFLVLHRLTSQAFIVDDNVRGRANVEFAGLGMEQALSELGRLGIRVSPPGGIRRVSRDAGPAPTTYEASTGGPRATLALKRSSVRDLLARMTDADSSLAALGPDGFLGRVSVWVRDLPLYDVRSAVLGAVGLTEHVEDDRRILSRRADPAAPVSAIAGDPTERRLVLSPQDLATDEFDLAGLASSGGGWTAFAYSPTGALFAYASGDRLFDGRVRAVSSTDVLLDTEEGPRRITLSGLR